MRRIILFLMICMLVPGTHAIIEELTITSCSGAGCNVGELNTYNNVSGMSVDKGAAKQETTGISVFSGSTQSTLHSVSSYFSHSGDAGISGSWTVDYQNSTDSTSYCTAATPHTTPWTQVTLTPTGCSWNPGKLKELKIVFTNNDGSGPDMAYIDFFNVSVNYTPPVQNTNERTTFVNETAATIAWETNIPANSTVDYGETTSLGNTSGTTASVSIHAINLANLNPNTQYWYNVTSCDTYTCDTTGPFTFTTDAALGPVIKDVKVASFTEQNATITWTTSAAANSTVHYGNTTSLGNTAWDATLVTSHSITLTGLEASTTYWYNVTSCDTNGCTTAGMYTFRTGPPRGNCTYTYTETVSGHIEGFLLDGEMIEIECWLPEPAGEDEDIHITLLWDEISASRRVHTPRLLYKDTEVLYP